MAAAEYECRVQRQFGVYKVARLAAQQDGDVRVTAGVSTTTRLTTKEKCAAQRPSQANALGEIARSVQDR
ncbi:MAG: hypothetical protein NTX31_04420 [Burkholderiales bacterium]|nr:hypothetical protein [Burkholderiales bacterium]